MRIFVSTVFAGTITELDVMASVKAVFGEVYDDLAVWDGFLKLFLNSMCQVFLSHLLQQLLHYLLPSECHFCLSLSPLPVFLLVRVRFMAFAGFWDFK